MVASSSRKCSLFVERIKECMLLVDVGGEHHNYRDKFMTLFEQISTSMWLDLFGNEELVQ
jgi:hypothetical protein